MRKAVILTLCLFLAAMVGIGCGEKVNDKTDTDTKVEAKTEVTADVNDTTAGPEEKRFPIRNENNKLVTLETNHGKMVLELFRDVAPAHADSFVARSAEGFYDGTKFHRVIKNFMIQGGDPQGTGMGNAGYFLNAEFSDLPHVEGTLSMARSRDPNSASCQFFICTARNRSTEGLDGQYTVFGQLIKGYDVLNSIKSTPCQPNPQNPTEVSVPDEEVTLIKAYLSDSEGNPL